MQLSREMNVPIAGKDFKTGQTFMKTLLAPGFKARMLGVNGWFSTNILGNRDGEVLDDPGSFKFGEESKLSALHQIFQPDLYPELYGEIHHKVRIEYYCRAATRKKAGTTSTSSAGSAIRCRSRSTSSAAIPSWPRLSCSTSCSLWTSRRCWHARRTGVALFFFKAPMTAPGLYPEHDIFIQSMKLKTRFAG